MIKAIVIYPENIGASGYWSENWIIFIEALGYSKDDIPQYVTIVPIDLRN